MSEIGEYVRRVMAVEDRAIMNAVRAGATWTPPCGVLVERGMETPVRITIDPKIPPWEVRERSVWGGLENRECRHGDPHCPCPDGDPCHYVGTGDSSAMPCPRTGVVDCGECLER